MRKNKNHERYIIRIIDSRAIIGGRVVYRGNHRRFDRPPNKRVKSVVAETDYDMQKARPSILTKLKEFGADVTSNIVANLLTNPMIREGL